MSVNVHVENKAPEKLLQLIANEQPAVVFVQEVSLTWATVLAKLPAYPCRKSMPRQDSFGIALLSKHPLEDVTVVEGGDFGIPAMAWDGT